MASKQGPASTSDGLPTGLVILSPESVPVELHSELQQATTALHGASLHLDQQRAGTNNDVRHEEQQQSNQIEDEGDNEVEFSQALEEHGITMVSSLSHMAHLDDDRFFDEEAVIDWLREILVEDDFGKVDCKVLIELTQKEFGNKRRKTRAWLKRAFPKSYLRRSDRNRWFCGVAFRADQGKSVISIKDKEWLERAVSWLQCSMEMNPTVRERCSDVHHALTQQVGQASVHMAISAVKMVFPNIPRKTFNRIAFYVGIRFTDPTLGHSAVDSASTTLNSISDIKTEYGDSAANKLIIAWLQKALTANQSKRERIKTISLMIKKNLGKSIPQAKVARLVKKAFPNVEVRSKGLADGIVWGVCINSSFRPVNTWVQKAVDWIRKILEPADPSYCENATAIFDLLTQKLGIQRKSKAVTLLHEAFPNVQLGDIRGFQVLFGVKQKDNIENVDYPVFTEEDLTLSDDIVSTDDADMVTDSSTQRVLEEQSPFVVGVPTSSSTPVTQTVSTPNLQTQDTAIRKKSNHTTNSQAPGLELTLKSPTLQQELVKISTKVSQIENNMSQMMKNMSEVKEQISKLIKDNAKSVQQKDSLIIQLQQTLIMLCQQQLQKFMPGDQNFPEQTLSALLQKGLMHQNETPEV